MFSEQRKILDALMILGSFISSVAAQGVYPSGNYPGGNNAGSTDGITGSTASTGCVAGLTTYLQPLQSGVCFSQIKAPADIYACSQVCAEINSCIAYTGLTVSLAPIINTSYRNRLVDLFCKKNRYQDPSIAIKQIYFPPRKLTVHRAWSSLPQNLLLMQPHIRMA
jgi:hypothetical protein